MLVIHIGPRKTASTYLQSNFYRNRKLLLKKGWLYPVLSLRARNAHHVIVQSLSDIRRGEGALVRSMARAGQLAAKNNANILVSSENFRKWKAADLALIGKRFGQAEIVVVYTLRDPMDLLLSNWSESVKIGKTASLADFTARHLADPVKSPLLNCLNQLDPIRARPELELKVLNFEEIKRGNGNIYQAFGRHILGLDDLQPARSKPANPSFPVEINDFLRLLSREMNYDATGSDLLLSRQFGRTHTATEIEHIASAIRRLGKEDCRTVFLSRDEPWYSALEANIRTELGPLLVPPSAAALFPKGVVESLSYDIDRLATHPEIRALLGRSIARVGKARSRWGRSPVVRAWRYLRRMISV